MSFISRIWKNRITANPNRRILTPTGATNEYDVTRSEGVISEEGDLFSAENMNDLESRIATAIDDLDSDKVSTTTTVNGHRLSDNVTVVRGDIAGIVMSNTTGSKTLTMSLSGTTLTITYQ